MALDRRNYRQVVETTVELAQKAGVAEIVGRIVNDLKVGYSTAVNLVSSRMLRRTKPNLIARWLWKLSLRL
jgi:hypothetical protein